MTRLKKMRAVAVMVLLILAGIACSADPGPVGMQVAALAPVTTPTPTVPEWDPRLDALGVRYEPTADCAEGCWKLISVRYEDEHESGGLHHIWFRALDENEVQVAGVPWFVSWPDGRDQLDSLPSPFWKDYPLWAGYNPDRERGPYSVDMGAHSDALTGLGLPWRHHVSFWLTYQWEPSDGEATPTATAVPCIGCDEELFLPVIRSQ